MTAVCVLLRTLFSRSTARDGGIPMIPTQPRGVRVPLSSAARMSSVDSENFARRTPIL